ncbi:MAG: DUF1648 domain-containing protein [Saccharofermentanales bacterium]|jgi:hypothetical protein
MIAIKFVKTIYWTLALMPLLVALVLVWLLPETIPVHADSSWQITRYGSRFEIFLIPAAVLLILTVFKFFFDLLERGGATSKGSRLFYSLYLLVGAAFSTLGIIGEFLPVFILAKQGILIP